MTEKSILITGCSSGIGLCAATVLKKRGYRVFATARQAKDIEILQSKGLESVQLDVNDPSTVSAALEFVLSHTQGKLDALFNNAGYLQVGAIEDLTNEIEKAQFETNVFGPMQLIRQVLPIMRRQGEGRIIQNSSILGMVTFPYYGAYNASKFALEGFTRTLRQELRGTKIHVSLINPGPIYSDLRDKAYIRYQQMGDIKTHSAYQAAYEDLENSYFRHDKNDKIKIGPEAVVKKLIHALESPRPNIHYFVGLPAHLLAALNKLLPERVFEWLLSRIN